MISKDAELIRNVYRLRCLLTTPEAAIESTFQLVHTWDGVTREEVQEIAALEDQRRKELIAQSWAAAKDLVD